MVPQFTFVPSPLSDEELQQIDRARTKYRMTNLKNGMEWAADDIHVEMVGLGPDTDPDDPIEPPSNPRDRIRTARE